MDAVVWLEEVGASDLSMGGKGASLGEMINIGVPVPCGFAVTAQAFQDFINRAGIAKKLEAINVDVNQEIQLHKAEKIERKIVLVAKVPEDTGQAIKYSYDEGLIGLNVFTEVQPEACLMGMAEAHLNIGVANKVVQIAQGCQSSFHDARTDFNWFDQHFGHIPSDIVWMRNNPHESSDQLHSATASQRSGCFKRYLIRPNLINLLESPDNGENCVLLKGGTKTLETSSTKCNCKNFYVIEVSHKIENWIVEIIEPYI